MLDKHWQAWQPSRAPSLVFGLLWVGKLLPRSPDAAWSLALEMVAYYEVEIDELPERGGG